jgi:hypothetical protein
MTALGEEDEAGEAEGDPLSSQQQTLPARGVGKSAGTIPVPAAPARNTSPVMANWVE